MTRDQVAPDHYTGSAYLSVKDGSSFLTVPVDVSVRSGPLWAILALLFGIVIGRLAVHMNTKGNQQATCLWQLYGLRSSARRRLSDPADRAALNELFDVAAGSIYAFDFEVAKTQLAEITAAIDLLAHAHDAAVALNALPAPPPNVATLVEALRQAIRSRSYDQAKGDLANLQALLPQVEATAATAAPAEARPAVADAVANAGAHLEMLNFGLDRLTNVAAVAAAALSHERQWLNQGAQAIKRVVYWLAGLAPAAAAEARLWLVRPLLTLILIVLLVGLGLKTLYAGDASFGSGGFVEYFALIIWGLSADVASRTLTTLGGNAAPTAAPSV